MNRRTVLKLGAGVGILGAAGYRFLPSWPSSRLESVDTLAQRLYTSLDEEQRAEACVSYDHPMRQYHNRGVPGGGRSVVLGFNRKQRGILTDLMYASLSEEGRERLPKQDVTRWMGVNTMQVLICGDPTSSPYQIIFSGVHLNLRVGGKGAEGAAFGGPQVYGDQRGDGRVGLPGNVYRDQFLMGQRLLHSVDEGRRKYALLEEAPVQTKIELQGRHGSFSGIPVAELSPNSRELAHQTVDHILSTYASSDAAYAHECLAANGGLDGLFLSYYQHDGNEGDIPEAQVFRLEGPGAVFYFRGYPHVHAFLNVAMDGDSPLSVGESLGTNPAWLDHEGVKALFEEALRVQTGADLAYYDKGSVAGRLRPGVVRSGDIYTLESWQENSAVVDVRGSDLSPIMQSSLRQRGVELKPEKTYSIATTAYIAGSEQEKLGRVGARRPGPMLRDLTVSYLKSHEFPKI